MLQVNGNFYKMRLKEMLILTEISKIHPFFVNENNFRI
jgi:hypothetical protein